MNQVAQTTPAQEQFMANFGALEAQPGPPWLAELRRAAMDRFEELGIPTTTIEAWRQSNLASLAETAFVPAPAADSRAYVAAARAALPGRRGPLLVFVNGRYTPGLSQAGVERAGIRATSLAAALETDPETVRPSLDRLAEDRESPFVALNTAFFADGACIVIPRGKVVEEAIQILYISLGGAEPTVNYPRSIILAGEASQARIVESFLGPEGDRYFCNAVTQLDLAQGAVIDRVFVQQESEAAFHISRFEARLGPGSVMHNYSIQSGARLARNEARAILDGEGGECHLNGLYLAHGGQHIDNHTLLDHVAPRCHSDELYKGILDDHATAVFSGKIHVHKGAQKTDAIQSNRGLLLSDSAILDSQPQLEIFADDVKCTHGASIGQVNRDAIFYLQTRGVDREAARGLLTYAFANEVIERLTIAPLRERLDDLLAAKFGLVSRREAQS
jgi:Fe-S cluster assembly protein SufD